MSPTVRHILLRYLYAVFYLTASVVGFCILFVVSEQFGKSNKSIFEGINPAILFLGRLSLFAAVSALILRLSPIRLGHFLKIHRYPPVYLAVFLGFLVTCFADCFEFLGTSEFRPPWWESIILSILGMLVVGAVALSTSVLGSESKETPATDETEDADFQTWLLTESPSSKDRFDRKRIATRLARHLSLKHGPGNDKTIGLVGRFGSGKSTIIGWIEEEAKKLRSEGAPELYIQTISCWGFDDAGSAIQYLLSKAIDVIGERVDCFSIRKIPEEYRQAISGKWNWLPSIVEFFLGKPDPARTLQGLSPILLAENARLVLVIEDLDRNKGSGFEVQDVLATLSRLRLIQGVSFILTGGSTPTSKIDFARLCDHIEQVPEVTPADSLKAIRTLRKQCLAMPFIDPIVEWRERDANWSGNVEMLSYLALSRRGASMACAALRLFGTPRTLKHVIRQTWQKLAGEIDLDDLIIANVIRHSAPEAFNFLINNIQTLRVDLNKSNSSPMSDTKEKEQLRKTVLRNWGEMTSAVEWDKDSAKDLVCYLVPTSENYFDEESILSWSSPRPQGVHVDSPTDYWERLLSEELYPDEISDQSVLKEIQQWIDNQESTKLAERLVEDSEFGDVWCHFSDRLTGILPLKIAEQVFEAAIGKLGPKASEENPGVVAVYRRVVLKYGHGESNYLWLGEQMKSALPKSLHLCCHLYHSWVNLAHFVNTDDVEKLRNMYVDASKTCFREDNPRAFINSVDPTCPYLAYWLVHPNRNYVEEAESQRDWRWFGKMLISAVSVDPSVVLPQICFLVTQEKSDRTTRDVYVVDEMIERVFGPDFQLILPFLVDPASKNLPDESKFLRASIARLVEWIREKKSPQNKRAKPA